MRIRVLSLVATALVLSLTAPTFAAESSCPVQLQEAQTHALLIDQSRDTLEQRLAQAIRANREYGQLHDADTAELKKLRDELAALKAKAAEAPKP